MKVLKHVAIIIETSRSYGRGLLRGVSRFHQERGSWSIYFQQQDLSPEVPAWLKSWRGDGILARIASTKMAEAVLATGLPVIDLRGGGLPLGMPQFGADNEKTCQCAYAHLRDQRLKQFAFLGEPPGRHYFDDQRRKAFMALVENDGGTCYDFQYRGGTRGRVHGAAERRQMMDWAAGLPKPVGIFAVHDDRGQQMLEVCRALNIAVPDDVAVIGVDNDEFLCNLAIPSLSSVDLNVERIGYEAANLLDQMMNKQARFETGIHFPPAGVVVRQSTDILMGSDRDITAAIRFIRQHACQGITVGDVEQHLAMSRSLFNRRFKQVVGRTPKSEILQVQLTKAKQLLTDTDLPISRIASSTGFSQSKYFIAVFSRRVGLTPRKFRLKHGRFNGLINGNPLEEGGLKLPRP